MRKKTIVILFGLGFGLSVIALVLFIGGLASLASIVTNCNDNVTPYSCNTSTPEVSFVALPLGVLFALAGEVLTIIAWVAILIKQAQRQQWAWFICTLIFGGICMLIWLIIEPEVPAVPHHAVSPHTGYAPSYPPAEQPRYPDPYRPQ